MRNVRAVKQQIVRPPFLLSMSFLDAICRAQPRAASKRTWANVCLRNGEELKLQQSVVVSIHERALASMIPVPAALVCPKACGTLAEDAFFLQITLLLEYRPSGPKRRRFTLSDCQEVDMSENQPVQV